MWFKQCLASEEEKDTVSRAVGELYVNCVLILMNLTHVYCLVMLYKYEREEKQSSL